MGEAVGHVPLEIQQRVFPVPWRQMRAMGDVLVREHFQVDAGVIRATATTSLPPILEVLRSHRDEVEEKGPGGSIWGGLVGWGQRACVPPHSPADVALEMGVDVGQGAWAHECVAST